MNGNTINNDVTMDGRASVLASRYRIIRQLGAGGMGSVWLAEDTKLDNKLFAIKMLPSILVSNKRAYKQLKEEALLAMKLVHPNIVQIRAFEENDNNPFLVMDYIEGQTLDDYLAEKGKLTEDETVKILKPIAAALDYAHGEGVVHRDVKPANVMIRKDGHPYILDFGIAREIQETMTRVTGKLSSGTLLYMSPEQLRGQPPKVAQDVYSFAAMAYECLKGEPPFSRGQIEYQILNEQPERLSDDIRMSASIMRGLSKTPESRPDSCVKMLLAASSIRQMPSVRPQVAVPPRSVAPMTDRIVVRPKRNIVGIVLPLFCLIVSLLVLGGVLWHREAKRQEDARRLAVEQQQEELRRRQAEDKRKAQEAAARKKAEAERLAKLKQEEAQRKAEEEAKRREAEKQAKERELARQKDEEARKAAEAEKAAIAARAKAETDTAMVLQRGKRALALLAIDPLQYESVSMDLTKEQRDLLSPVFKEIVMGEASLKALLSSYTLNHPEVRILKKAQEDRIASFKMTVEMLRSGKLSGAGQQSDRMQLPPTMQVTAKVNGEEMSGAILNDGSKDFNLPVKWTLARGKKYGPYSVMCQRNGIRYVGTFAQVTADWQGEKNVSVELSRNENKSQKELLPFYFQTCTPIPNGRHRFTFRDNKGRKDPYGNVMVYSVLKGEEIGKSGFIVTGYENKTETMVVPGSGSKLKRTVDVSTVEITRLSDGYKVNLLIGDRQCYVPVEWTLHRGKIYGPYRVSCERGGSQYEGKLERTSSDWDGIKKANVVLTKAAAANNAKEVGVDGNAVMRRLLVGKWSGTTRRVDKYKSNSILAFGGGSEWSRRCDYSWTFQDDGTVSQSCRMSETVDANNPYIKIGRSSIAQLGTWTLLGEGTILEVHVTAGAYKGKTFRYMIIKHPGNRIEFKTEEDSLKNLRLIANAINERHWYDNDGNYHYEGVCKTSNVRSIISETPRVFDKVQ